VLPLSKTCGKLGANPRKHPEKTAAIRNKKANTRRRPYQYVFQRFISILLNINDLFLLGFLLDTPLPRPYYAARKF
jgi:hypothetical protein